MHDLDDDRREPPEEIHQGFALVGRDQYQGDAEEDGEENDLEHAAVVAQGTEDVVGGHVHEDLQRTAIFGRFGPLHVRFRIGLVGRLQLFLQPLGHTGPGFEQVDQDKSDGHGDGRREDVNGDRPSPDAR